MFLLPPTDSNKATVALNPAYSASPACRALQGKGAEAWAVAVNNGVLKLAGTDPRGLAYALISLSRLIGVNPWEWWADVPVQQRDSFTLSADFISVEQPSVRWCGIFINDEDWGFMPWSSFTIEPANLGHIGPVTYAKVCELLLRLRLNLLWPAMHECTYPFFLTAGNVQTAANYGIVLGASHAEPMACSAAREWDIRGHGDYNFKTNREGVIRFWQERLDELSAQQEVMYTLGMRGKHDGVMQGTTSEEESLAILHEVLGVQRHMLQEKYGHEMPPQVFIPYKEVLTLYRKGLAVPDDVTLMWTDDNYGYMQHLPTPQERERSGGNGLYTGIGLLIVTTYAVFLLDKPISDKPMP